MCIEMLASCKSKLGFERLYDIVGWKGDQLQETREAPDGNCCVAGAQNEKEECQIYAVESGWGLRRVQTSGGVPNRRGGSGVRNKIKKRRYWQWSTQSRQRSTNGDWRVLSQRRSAENWEGGYGVWKPICEWQPRPRSAGGNWWASIPGWGVWKW